MKYLIVFVSFLFILCIAMANNPGNHAVNLTWNAPTCLAPSCTFNVYRSTSPNSCGIGKTPFANVTTNAYEDDTVVAGTSYYYSITAYPAVGGESNCSTELQVPVSSTQATTPSVPQGQSH